MGQSTGSSSSATLHISPQRMGEMGIFEDRCVTVATSATIPTVPCDEGGWVKTNDIVGLSTCYGRILQGVSPRRIKFAIVKAAIHQECLQLLIEGKNLNASAYRNAKIKLQFLGIRVADPPNGDQSASGDPSSDELVVKTTDEDLDFNKNWVR